MMKNISYRQRFIYLLIGGVLICWLVYGLSLSETFRVRKEYKVLATRLDKANTAGASVLFYERELKKIDSLIGADSYVGNYTQEILLNKITRFARKHQVMIVNFPKPHFFFEGKYKVYTYKADVEGTYQKLLRLLYELETENYPGVMKSARFELVKQPGMKKENLILSLYFQEIKIEQEILKE